MTRIRRPLSIGVAVLLLGGVFAWTRAGLPGFPPHDYTLEWFLKLAPGELVRVDVGFRFDADLF